MLLKLLSGCDMLTVIDSAIVQQQLNCLSIVNSIVLSVADVRLSKCYAINLVLLHCFTYQS